MEIETFSPIINVKVFLLAIAGLLILATYTWQFKKMIGAKVQVYLQLSKTFWLVTMLMLAVSETLADKSFWVIWAQATSLLSPYLWFLFILQISGQIKLIPLKLQSFILLTTTTFLLVILSNPWHGLYYSNIMLENNILICSFGSLFNLEGYWAYALCFFALTFSFRWIIVSKGLRRKQALWFTASGLMSLLTVMLGFVFKIDSINSMPLGFLIAAAFVAWGFYRWKVYNLIPFAHEAAINNMIDGLIVIDENNYVATMNQSAQKLLNLTTIKIGSTFYDLLEVFPNLELFQNNQNCGSIETTMTFAEKKHYQQWNLILLQFQNYPLGKVLLIKDITKQKQEQQSLLEHEKSLAIIEERHSLAREVHDDLCQTLGYISFQIQDIIHSLKGKEIDKSILNLTKLVKITKNAYTDAREYIKGVQYFKLEHNNLLLALEKYINWVKQEYRLNIILISPLSTAVYANNNLIDLHLFRIIQEALSNIVKHAKAENCLITFKVDQDLITVTISDDGVGFNPENELTGFGLTSMAERTKRINGTFEVTSTIDTGTIISIKIPLA